MLCCLIFTVRCACTACLLVFHVVNAVPLQVRYVKADDIWLSPNYQRESCHMTFLIYNPTLETMAYYFDLLYNATRQFNPRLHWGKYMSVGREEVEQMYPRLQDFARIRAEMDPNGIFLNDILTTTFGFE